MTVKVRIPMALRRLTGGKGEVEAEGRNLKDLIDSLDAEYGGFKDALCDGSGKVRGYVNLYVNNEDFRSLEDIQTPLKEGDEVAIVPAIAGGFRW